MYFLNINLYFMQLLNFHINSVGQFMLILTCNVYILWNIITLLTLYAFLLQRLAVRESIITITYPDLNIRINFLQI